MPWVSPEFAYPEVPNFISPVAAANVLKFEQRRTAENSSRLAFCMGTFSTTGWGEYQMPEAFTFDCLFVGEPYVLTGWSAHGQQLVATRYPRVSSGVTEFHYDARNLYSSAHLAFTVETRSPEDIADQDQNIPDYTIVHYFMFVGIGMKQLPRLKQ